MIRPFYRSRLFWLGVPGLVFLLWGWWDSGGNLTIGKWQIENIRSFGIETEPGYLILSWTVPKGSVTAKRSGGKPFDFRHIDFGREHQWDFPPAIGWWSSDDDDGPFYSEFSVTKNVRIAWWLIAVAYVVLWLSAAFWWQRRKARLLKLHAAPET